MLKTKTETNHTFFKSSCSPGASMIHPTTVPNRSMMAYIIRVDVELRHAGQAVHKEHAALPQQQASWKRR